MSESIRMRMMFLLDLILRYIQLLKIFVENLAMIPILARHTQYGLL